jgi:hypothetical protein
MGKTEKKLFGFLDELGCKEHSHGEQSLYDHLVGTYNILLRDDHPFDTALAGLFHAVYGTTSYPFELIKEEDRFRVQDLIGKKAEELAFRFGTLPLPREENILKITDLRLQRALMAIHVANQEDSHAVPIDNVIRLRDFQDEVKVEPHDHLDLSGPFFQCFMDDVKTSLHQSVQARWARKLVEALTLDFKEDPDTAEEIARVMTAQAVLSLASNYAADLDRDFETVFAGAGTAKNLFLECYEKDMGEQNDG